MTDTTHSLETALSLCTYCPSLCRQACPVATVEASDTVTPWGKMSLARHLSVGKVTADREVARVLAACTGCGACTAVCNHEVDVGGVLAEMRSGLASSGFLPSVESLTRPPVPLDHPCFAELRASARYEPRPAVSLMPGRTTIEHLPGLVHRLHGLCERLDVDALACGELARLDTGYDLWHHGHHAAFVERAREVHAAAAGARDIVVMSPESLYALRVIYPRFGLSIGASLLHVSEFLLPLLSGAVVTRQPGKVAYHESCHLSRHLGLADLPRQVLRRVLVEPLLELPARAETTGCCGGSGLAPDRAATGLAMGDAVLEAAVDVGIERIVSFSTECLGSLAHAAARRRAAGLPTPTVEHAIDLIAAAVVRDWSAS